MDAAPVCARPAGVVAVVLLTVLYSVERLVAAILATGYLLPHGASGGELAMWSGLAGFVVAYLLWRGRFVGWLAAVVLYGLLLLDFALGASVFALTKLPFVAVALVVLAYLSTARDRFQTSPSTG